MIEGQPGVAVGDGDILEYDARCVSIVLTQTLEHIGNRFNHDATPATCMDHRAEVVVLLTVVGADLHEERVWVSVGKSSDQPRPRHAMKEALVSKLPPDVPKRRSDVEPRARSRNETVEEAGGRQWISRPSSDAGLERSSPRSVQRVQNDSNEG